MVIKIKSPTIPDFYFKFFWFLPYNLFMFQLFVFLFLLHNVDPGLFVFFIFLTFLSILMPT